MTAATGQNGSIGRLLHSALRNQIKTRDRVRDLAEVYTHEREVHAMLDLVPDMFPTEDDPGNHDRTFSGTGVRLRATSWRRSSGASSRTVTAQPLRAR